MNAAATSVPSYRNQNIINVNWTLATLIFWLRYFPLWHKKLVVGMFLAAGGMSFVNFVCDKFNIRHPFDPVLVPAKEDTPKDKGI